MPYHMWSHYISCSLPKSGLDAYVPTFQVSFNHWDPAALIILYPVQWNLDMNKSVATHERMKLLKQCHVRAQKIKVLS